MTTQATHSVAIVGASGRMGKALIEALDASPDCRLVAAVDIPSSADLGQVVGKQNKVRIGSDLNTEFTKAHCLIDFTRPQGCMEHLAVCQSLGLQMVIGTTGFSPEQKEQIVQASKDIAIMMAPNMSVGVNVTLKLLQMAAKSFAQSYDVEIIEAHHKHKVDAPSGTALLMGEVIANAQGNRLQDVAVFERYGDTGERTQGSIGFATVRGGDIVGDHTVLFAGSGERIEIAHKSSSRDAYAQGSLRAVRFLAQQTTGLFDMSDVLGLNHS